MVRTKKQVVDSLSKNKASDQYNAEYRFEFDSLDNNIKTTAAIASNFYAPTMPTSPIPNAKEKAAGFSLPHGPLLPLAPDSLYDRPTSEINRIWCSPAMLSPSPFTTSISYKNLVASKQKLHSLFSNLSPQEINEMLIDCGYNEDEVILRLITQATYLESIRFRVEQQQSQFAYIDRPYHIPMVPTNIGGTKTRTALPPNIVDVTPTLKTPGNEQQFQQHQQFRQQQQHQQQLQHQHQQQQKPPIRLQPKRQTKVQKATSTDLDKPMLPENDHADSQNQAKSPVSVKTDLIAQDTKYMKQSKNRTKEGAAALRGRLALDDALQQIEDSKKNNVADAFAGWSQARIRAFDMMEKNPNSYYYRFNAPGEQQRKGKWTDEENQLFMDRLSTLGANQQWGIFSMAIPGRVGYQCSNYYRYMIESGQIKDPNYVLDEKGKARYLFEKKTNDGHVEKIFRKHSKHGSIVATEEDLRGGVAGTSLAKRKSNKRYQCSSDEESADSTFKLKKPAKSKASNTHRTKTSNRDGIVLPSPNVRMTRRRYLEEQQKEQNDHVVPYS